MAVTKIGLIGSGWRAEFFIRVAKALPHRFQICSALVRDAAKGAAFALAHQVPVVNDLDALLDRAPDYVVLAVARGHVLEPLWALMDRGVPVLCETPPGESVAQLTQLWHYAVAKQARLRIAEQYPSQPLYMAYAQIVGQGLLGEVDSMALSALHGYHAVAIFRRLLGIGFENARIFGARHQCRVVETLGRGGLVADGAMQSYTRERLTLAFDGGKLAFYDFSDPAQYHSMLRTRQWTVQGTRGEIDDLTVRYLAGGLPVAPQLVRLDFGANGNHEWAHYGYMLGERLLYRNPYYPARLNDDEIAVAACMEGMAEYLQSGQGGYALADGLQDTYLSILMRDAAQSGQPITSTAQPWAQKG